MIVSHLTSQLGAVGGGVAIAVRHLAEASASLDVEAVRVLGLRTQGEEEPIASSRISLLAFSPLGPRSLGFTPAFKRVLLDDSPDILHRHGLWMYPSRAANAWQARTGRPVVVSPHGMLDPWALRNSAWRKRIAGAAFERRSLERASCLHALNTAEAEAIRAYGLQNPIAVIPNGVGVPPDEPARDAPWAGRVPEDARVLLFLGRFHPKKGLSELIRALGMIMDEGPSRYWHLVVVGWDDGGHVEDLKRQARGMDVASRVHWLGPLFGEGKAAALRNADAFVLPSHSEGLPVAVLEAWSYRLPVLMTDACNIPEGFERGAAVRISTGPAALAKQLREFFTRTAKERAAMGRRGRQLVDERFTWPSIAAEMIEVYRWLLGEADRPASVLPERG